MENKLIAVLAHLPDVSPARGLVYELAHLSDTRSTKNIKPCNILQFFVEIPNYKDFEQAIGALSYEFLSAIASATPAIADEEFI